ncbi:hypothetical protein [Raoultibacter timonensis]|uniref:hypothetical protein n=1 Tax=Raoultibacter timonensis TaxID=1907662 RepID=UPI0026DCEBE7|nr:hypothetical protein [Raoultibacter timonensis]
MPRSIFGHIEWLGGDRYRVWWENGRKPDGSRRQSSKVVRGTRDDAELFLAKMRLESGKGFDVDDITVGEYWTGWFRPQLYDLHEAGEGMAMGTIKNYESLWRAHLRSLFENDVMQDCAMREIDRKLLKIEGAYPRFQSMKLLRKMFNQAWNDDMIGSNPFLKKTRISAPRKKDQDVLKPSELIAWVHGIMGFVHAAAILILVFGGLRREEVVPLWWDSDVIHFVKARPDGSVRHYQHVHIREAETDYELKETKTAESERIVVIAGRPAEWIESLREPGKKVFHGVKGGNVQPCRLTKNYKLWCERNGIRYVTPKNLRTTYGTFRQTYGADPTVTSKSMGHARLNVDYDHYLVTQMPAFEREADRMADVVDDMLLHDVTPLDAQKSKKARAL